MGNFKDYFSRIDRLTNLYLSQDELPVIALVGPYNTGKSTMVNNLLEQRVSPVDILPTTSVPLIFSHGKLFSIIARLAGGRIKILNKHELESLPRGGVSFAGQVLQVEIILNHELLHRMHLVDTPGFDAVTGTGELPDTIARANHIVYMLHQRGVGEADRKFIRRLLDSAGVGKLSFWINRNLGHYDGTSLTESRRVLREICGREIRVHVTDTMNREAVRRFRLFIEDQAAAVVIRKVTHRLKELDRRIPEQVASSLREESDTFFLLRFWDAKQSAWQVVRGQNIIQTLHPVSQQIRNSVDELIKPGNKPAGSPSVHRVQGPVPNPAMVKDKIQSLLTRAASDPALHSRGETAAQLRALAGELTRERFLVTAAGGFSTGKTTFFNALLGEALLPAENRPTTFTVTRLVYGTRKKAVVKFANRVTIPTHYVEKKHVIICRHELEILEQWLTDPQLCSGFGALEKVRNGRSVNISPGELLADIEKLKETFARVKRSPQKSGRSWKSLFKRIPLQKFKDSEQADHFVVHFPNRENIELDLTSEAEIEVLKQTASSHRALQVEEIEIHHPAGILRTADFLDTPGLDSVYHRHREITTRYFSISDCFLFFLNGKHILTRPDLGTYKTISDTLDKARKNSAKLFIIVNFADTLNERERERVRNYLHVNLIRPSRGVLDPARVYLISALDALTGKDNGALSSLTADLNRRIWFSRCAGNYAGIIRRATAVLTDLVEQKPQATRTSFPQDEQLRQDMERVLHETALKMASWHRIIESFNGPVDFLGFRDGQKPVQKGFLGLVKKPVPSLSYRDLAAEFDNILNQFKSKWFPDPEININGLDIADWQEVLNRLIKDQTVQPEEARNNLHTLLNKEEMRIRETIQQLVNKRQRGAPVTLSRPATEPDRLLVLAVNKYTLELATLEKEIITPGGNADGKCQDTG